MNESKQQIVVLCGPDHTGKTNIARELSKVIDVPYFKSSNEHATYLQNKDLFINQLRYADMRMVDFSTRPATASSWTVVGHVSGCIPKSWAVRQTT